MLSAIHAVILGVLAALNADNGAQAQTYFAPDAVVVDSTSPFLWSGPNAAARWWRKVDKVLASTHSSGTLHATLVRETDAKLDREGDDAYVNAILRITIGNPVKKTEDGSWVLTFHHYADGWKISSASWGTWAQH
jgi:ketosteroid isomerase-like protein